MNPLDILLYYLDFWVHFYILWHISFIIEPQNLLVIHPMEFTALTVGTDGVIQTTHTTGIAKLSAQPMVNFNR